MGFDEHSEKGQEIIKAVEIYLGAVALEFNVSFKDPHHDIARRFLNEIEEFKATEE